MEKASECPTIGTATLTHLLLVALFLTVSMWLTPSYATKVQRRELGRVGAFLVIEEVGKKMAEGIATPSKLQARWKTAMKKRIYSLLAYKCCRAYASAFR